MTNQGHSTEAFRSARDLLLARRDDYAAASRDFSWPQLGEFNWALDWFDVLAREHPDRLALWIVTEDGPDTRLSYAELSARSDQVATWLRGLGVGRGDRVLLMLGNQAPLWEVILAAMKLGAVIIPATTLLGPDDIADRISRGGIRHVITESDQTGKFAGLLGDGLTAVAVGPPVRAWHSYEDSRQAPAHFEPDGVTRAADPLLLYFTSGTTARPKLVEHSHVSYPVGHLSTMYWLGLQPGDVHLNISSPGWGKHAWSNVYAPWIAGATALVTDYRRFSAKSLLEAMVRCGATTFCAPPTVWRILIQEDLGTAPVTLRECVSAGEPLNPEVIQKVRKAWGITVRDGYGQTETTAQIGNSPGQPVKPGSMGRPLPGYTVALVAASADTPADEGEICLDLSQRPLGLMTGYLGDAALTAAASRGGYFHSGDVASRDAEGYITYVGRTDDLFKASDYLISPFELENVLVEHAAVTEAAVVPSPDTIRLAVPKAYVALTAGWEPTADTALAILKYARDRLAPYKRVRRIEFADLPKTISGKIRRVELRDVEESRYGAAAPPGADRGPGEFWEEDFPRLKG